MSAGKTEHSAKDVCVCVLAHNEEKHIARTIHSIQAGNHEIVFELKVYANGCTDATAEIVTNLCKTYPNLVLREIPVASKANAWNVAFTENESKIIVFFDGDVILNQGAVDELCRELVNNSKLVLTCLQFWPYSETLSIEKWLVGFLQIPLSQDFLSGQFYALKRDYFKMKFDNYGVQGLPNGLVAEDTLIELLSGQDRFLVLDRKGFYEPPTFADYLKYLARMQWQEEQLKLIDSKYFRSHLFRNKDNRKKIFLQKISGAGSMGGVLLGLSSNIARFLVKNAFRTKIHSHYRRLGPVVEQGSFVLSRATRSMSSK